ncbi:MAG: hypothetical protein PQJ50_15225 [Spirochaetales bacterium]|nr:hypothetical protein [Spirochaetales bacterium]
MIYLPTLLSAYEHTGGVRLDLNAEGPDIYGTVAEFTTTDKLSLWYESSLNDLFKFSFDGSLVYDANARIAADFNQELSYLGLDGEFYPELNALNMYGKYAGFNYRAGRQLFADPSALIIAHPLDGLAISMRLGPGLLSTTLGYTGLVNSKASDITMTSSDVNLASDSDSFFGPSRIIESVSYTYPEILGPYMTLTGGITAQQDMIKDEKISTGSDRLHTVYFQLDMEGFLLPVLMYDTSLVFQTGALGDLTSNGYLGEFTLYFLPGGTNSFVSLGALVSSGEKWENREDYYGQNASGSQNQFIPISNSGSRGYVLDLNLGNLTAIELLVSLSGSNRFAFELSTTTLLRTVNGPVSSSLIVDNGEDSLFIGQEALMAFKFRPASDFGASINLGVLVPGEAVTINEELEPFLPVLPKIGFDLSFSF